MQSVDKLIRLSIRQLHRFFPPELRLNLSLSQPVLCIENTLIYITDHRAGESDRHILDSWQNERPNDLGKHDAGVDYHVQTDLR